MLLRGRNRTASSRAQHGAGSVHPDAHFFDCLADGRQERPHVRLENAPDGADAESVGLADLAGINNKALVAEQAVKRGEREPWIGGKTKRSDDAALHAGIPPSSSSSLKACSKARMAWVGGVYRNWPFFSKPRS